MTPTELTSQAKQPRSALLIISTAFFEPDESEIPFEGGLTMYIDKTIAELDDRIGNPAVWVALGTTFRESLLGEPYFVGHLPFTDEDDLKVKALETIQSINLFLSLRWFIEDCNSFVTISGYFADSDTHGTVNLPMMITSADGHLKSKKFPFEPSNYTVGYIYKKLSEIGLSKPNTTILKQTGSLNKSTIRYSIPSDFDSSNKIERAVGFLTKARACISLPEKISNYVLIFECLFAANSEQEIAHKISERVAAYIGTTAKEKIAIFDIVKKLYTIRSKYVHGQPVYKKVGDSQRITDLSVKADNLLRAILTKVIIEDADQFLKKDEELNNWFNDLIFQPSVPPTNQSG